VGCLSSCSLNDLSGAGRLKTGRGSTSTKGIDRYYPIGVM